MSRLISKSVGNSSAIYTSDTHNISNTNNQIIFNKMMSGIIETPSLSYLMNYQVMRLNDVKSVLEYNYGNISLMLAENAQMEEIFDEFTVYLPKCKKKMWGNLTLEKALEKRRTVRSYTGKPVRLKELSTLLNYGLGVRNEKEIINGYEVPLRYYGSGGGLYPIRPYIFINRVENLEKGVYKYQPFSHTVRRIEHENITLDEVYSTQKSVDISNLAFAIFFVYEMNRSYVKYGELALAHAFIEVGLMSQNLHLLSQGLGIGTCDMGGFNKVLLERKMQLCGVNRHVIFSIVFGKVEEKVEI